MREFVVDQWTMWRTSHLLHHFLFPWMLSQTIFLEVWLLVNEEIHTLPIIMKLGNLISSSWKCLPSASRALHQERRERWGFTWEPFFPLFLNYFELSDVTLADISLWIKWARFLCFWVLGLVDGWKPFLFIFLLPWTTGPNGLRAFSKFLDFWIWFAVDRKNGPLQYFMGKIEFQLSSLWRKMVLISFILLYW